MSDSNNKDRELIETLVRTSLVHFQNWSEVVLSEKSIEWKQTKVRLLSGRPPNKLSNDDDDETIISKEYFLPLSLSQYKSESITVELMDLIFQQLCEQNTKRIILAIVNDDGTVVYYFAYKGLYKPKKN